MIFMTGRSLTPETNNSESVMQPSTVAVPISGWARIRTQAKPVTMSTGPMMRRSAESSSIRRATKSATNSVSANFMSSEGCMRNWPKPTHRLDPSVWTPKPGTRTMHSNPKVTTRISGLSRRSLR